MVRIIRISAILSVAFISMYALALPQSGQPTPGTTAQAEQAPAAAIPPDQQPAKEQLAKLFEVMRLREQMQSMRQIMPAMVQQQIQSAMKQTEADLPAGAKLTAEQREAMQSVMSKYVGRAMDLYPTDEMLTDMTTIYQQHLSKDDVDLLITFYGSPAGKHLLDAQPVIAKEYMPMVMGKVTERSQAMIKEMMKEMAEVMPAAKPAAAKPAAKAGTTKPSAH